MSDVARWYFPDGNWHASVAYRRPALHLEHSDIRGAARCNSQTMVLNIDESGYSTEEAIAMKLACNAACA